MWPERVNPEGEDAGAAFDEQLDERLGAALGGAPPFRLDRIVTPVGGPAVITVAGAVDFDCATDFHRSVLTAVPTAAHGLDLDLSAVVFCDCAFVNALLSVRGQLLATGRTVTLTACSPAVTRLLELLDLRDLFAAPASDIPAGRKRSTVARPASIRQPPATSAGLDGAVADIAECLVAGTDAVEILDTVLRGCAAAFAVDGADIAVLDEECALRDLACSNEPAGRFVALESSTDEGPTAECARTGEPVNIADLRTQLDHWPHFAPLALQEGLRSVQALPLRDGRNTLGALTLFGRAAGSLPEKEMRSAQVFADLTVVALRRAVRSPRPLADSVRGIIAGRSAIERAKGLIAESGALGVADADDLLRSHARRTRRPLVDTARAVVRGDVLPSDVLAVRSPDRLPDLRDGAFG